MNTPKLVIFDVDGTLVTTESGDTFRRSANDWKWLPGCLAKCRILRDQGIRLALATNQAVVAFPWSKMTEQAIQREIEKVGAAIDTSFIGICFSTPNEKALSQYHHPNDPRRKPNPGMLTEAMVACHVTPEETLYVGDRPEDEEAAARAGCNFQWAESFFS